MSRECSVDTFTCDQNRDMVTGVNPNPHTVPEFLTGRPMQSKNPCIVKIPTINNDESQYTVPQVLVTTNQTIPSDIINQSCGSIGRHA